MMEFGLNYQLKALKNMLSHRLLMGQRGGRWWYIPVVGYF
jgi:hypothetical protein